ncbi:MAG: FtsW/RodA/SpoVE family cell cycle protein [bacterium]
MSALGLRGRRRGDAARNRRADAARNGGGPDPGTTGSDGRSDQAADERRPDSERSSDPRMPAGRGTELVLSLAAVVVVAAAEAIIEATRDGRVSGRIASYGTFALVLALVAHIAIRWRARYADPVLLPCVVLINGLGLVMIHRLDLGLKQSAAEGGPDRYSGPSAPTQVVWTALGLALFVGILLFLRDHRVLARYGYTLGLAGLVFLALPSVLPARISQVNGARIWIRVGGFSIQPGELSKIALTIFAAAYLVSKRDVLSAAGRTVLGLELPRGRDVGPLVLAWLICIGVLVRGHDLGTSLMFFGVFVVLLYVATERVSWLVIGLLLFAGGTYLAYQLFDTLRTRVDVWLHPFDTGDAGYQLSQSLFGLGTGGLFGTGLGGGRPETVPVVKSDFIVSAFGEELGLFGLVAILTVYGLLIFRGLSAALSARDAFSKLLATGLSFSLGLQTFIVMAGATRLLPETGLTMPFLSYGGSSLVANYVLLALLVRVSDAARRPRPVGPADATEDEPAEVAA